MNRVLKTWHGRVLTVAATCFAVSLSAVLIRVLTHVRAGRWTELLRDAGHNIFGIPWELVAAAAICFALLAVLAQPELLAFLPDLLPEIGEVAAEGIDIGTEGAIEQEEAAAANRLQAEIASKVNPLGGEFNCPWTARETDQAFADMFAGRTPDPWAPKWFGEEAAEGGLRPPPGADLARTAELVQEFGGLQETSMEGIAEQLKAAGNGARGIVRVAGESGQGHVFNAVNYGGEVFFVDGQSGAVWTSTDVLPGNWAAADPDVFFVSTAG